MSGRPTLFNKEVADKICQRLMLGESLRKICKDNDMPELSTVIYWLQDSEEKKEFIMQYARAREVQMELMGDDILEIADDGTNDLMIIENGAEIENKEVTNRSKLRVETRKWIMSKLAPKKYGDKIDVTTGGEALNLPPPSFIVPKKQVDGEPAES